LIAIIFNVVVLIFLLWAKFYKEYLERKYMKRYLKHLIRERKKRENGHI